MHFADGSYIFHKRVDKVFRGKAIDGCVYLWDKDTVFVLFFNCDI